MRSTSKQLWLATSVACLLSAAPGEAEVRLAAEGAFKALCADQSGAKHPKRSELHHVVSPDPSATSALLLLQYGSDEPGKSGRIDADVKLSSLDGSQTRLGKLKAQTDAETGEGEASDVVPANLDSAAAASWDVRFKKFKALQPRDCVVFFVAVGPAAGD